MAFEIAWLESARRELDAEIEYVYSEFGEDSARRARTKIKEAVDPLDTFPDSGMRCDGFMYHGHEVRMIHVRQLTVFYSFDEISLVTILAVWNNYQDPAKINVILNSKQ